MNNQNNEFTNNYFQNVDNDGFVPTSEFMNKETEENPKVQFEYKGEKVQFESYITKKGWICLGVVTVLILVGCLIIKYCVA